MTTPEAQAPGFTDVWLFYGPHQEKQASQWAEGNARVTLVPRSGKGSNALDFHLSFYLGYVAAKHPAAHLVVVANDKGYDPMLAHARLLKFTVNRIGHKAKTPPVKNGAAPVKLAVAAKKAPKNMATVQKTPAKRSPPVKKAASKALVLTKMTARPSTKQAPELKEFTRVKNALAKMGDKRPHKLPSFLRHLQSMLGVGATAEAIDVMVQKLEKDKVVRIAGDLVLYD